MMKSTFRERLLEAKEMRGTKAADLARMSGLSKAQISQYMNGHHEARQKPLHQLAAALRVDESWLMGCDVPAERNDEPDADLLAEEEKAMLWLIHSVPKEVQRDILGVIQVLLELPAEDRKKYLEKLKNLKNFENLKNLSDHEPKNPQLF